MKRSGEWIACVGPFLFPWGDASSRRVFGLVGSLAAAGQQVVVASGDAQPRVPTPVPGFDGPGTVSHVGLGEAPAAGAGLLRVSVRAFVTWGRRTVRWLEEQPTKPSHVLLHGGQAQYAHQLIRWCTRHRVPLVADVVDWYNGRYVRGGRFGPLNASMKLALRHHYPRCDGIIAISALLTEYYEARVRAVVRVPSTVDVANLPLLAPKRRRGAALVIAYAGNPGRNNKDLLSHVVLAAQRAHCAQAPVELRILGPSPDEVRALIGGALPANVRALGRLAQHEVPFAVQQADFTVLLRRPERASNAGFSTKFCESLANGVPVIANLTGDMAEYLHHGVEGLVCPDYSVESVTQTLRAAARLSDGDRAQLRVAARERALKSLDYRVHAVALGEFFDRLRA
ncbi:glycosyltransferase family 4 protein [Verrucosispora sp. WMMD573]|uniref:glycosyltransferase family 4 protein n=1 Tax=Verrucosispora sp. WMMD573 TaxID=3015149 RepID=UPI00248BADEB|nr:glycosyltransferase family 4 protein [Verrucosispora sp. WMMD573]WBB52086.1 glycosyltransferase family 4 protein [Verrucosispora sp. WMMD573]